MGHAMRSRISDNMGRRLDRSPDDEGQVERSKDLGQARRPRKPAEWQWVGL
jgi:hypothetical protein